MHTGACFYTSVMPSWRWAVMRGRTGGGATLTIRIHHWSSITLSTEKSYRSHSCVTVTFRKSKGQSFFYWLGKRRKLYILEKQAQLPKMGPSSPTCLSWAVDSFDEWWLQGQAFSTAAEQMDDLIRKCAQKGIIQCLMKENATQSEYCDL